MAKQTRSPKQLGDFGEGLVTYTLNRKGYEVAYVDHVGADLIAEKNRRRYAISVKFRLFREDSNESRMVSISYNDIEKLETFSRQFDMIPLFAQVVSIADERTIHLFIISVENIKRVLPKRVHGYIVFDRKNFIPMRFSMVSGISVSMLLQNSMMRKICRISVLRLLVPLLYTSKTYWRVLF
ncbi:MAG: hypothetical protein U9O96_03365 [Candidatus Thermoplasmatota archaeon]|nr:hypothetical protein [Candidatus Thermoplasmatota archaeon]